MNPSNPEPTPAMLSYRHAFHANTEGLDAGYMANKMCN